MFRLLRQVPEEALQPDQKDRLDRLSELEKLRERIVQLAKSRDPEKLAKILALANEEGSSSSVPEKPAEVAEKLAEKIWEHIPSCPAFSKKSDT